MITQAKAKLPKYGLKGVSLVVQQGFNQTTDINQLKSMLVQDLYHNSEDVLRQQSMQIDSLKRNLDWYRANDQMASQLVPELKVLFPNVNQISCSHTYR